MKIVNKISFIAMVVWLLSATQAHAYFPGGWRVDAQVYVQNNNISASVYNRWGRPVICRGQAYGQTRNGMTYNSWMNNTIIHPGRSYSIYVYTNYFNPFVNGWADIWCRYSHY